MFYELENQTWTPSDSSVVIENNTDTSIDGSCRKITWNNALGEYVTITFDEVTFSDYEEISLYLYIKDQLSSSDLFTITIGTEVLSFGRDEFRRGHWNHILINCSDIGAVDEITIESLVDDLVIMIDYIGCRKVTYNCDVDIIECLKDHITLDYDVETKLTASAAIGDTSIALDVMSYINENTLLRLDDGAGVTEDVKLVDLDGNIETPLANDFPKDSVVYALCPVLSEDYDNVEPDPICGIKVYDVSVSKDDTTLKTKNRSKIKEYLGALGVVIYIDCSSKKKLLQLAREFQMKYGKEFQFLLDGELVDIYLDNSLYTDSEINNNPRIAYFYRIEPQPYLLVNRVPIETVNLTLESKDTSVVNMTPIGWEELI